MAIRTLLLLPLAGLLAASAVAAEGASRLFGAGMPTGEPVPIGAALRAPMPAAGEPGKYSGRVTEVCQQRGCWMVLADGESFARVVVPDHAWELPRDASGRAVVYGTMELAELDAGTAEHLAKDGLSGARAGEELRIVATSVELLD